MSDITYPIAEIFFSTQGEGYNTGRAMVFVRLAGCTVGKRYPAKSYEAPTLLPIFTNECTTYDGRKFPCDTDYRNKERMTIAQIINAIDAPAFYGCTWVSITGGEPLMHDLVPLASALRMHGYKLHLETSGTIPLSSDKLAALIKFKHVVVSPKFPYIDGYTRCANEIRLLIDKDFNWEKVPASIRGRSDIVWISPIGETNALTEENVKLCTKLQAQDPKIRISLQIHKILNVR